MKAKFINYFKAHGFGALLDDVYFKCTSVVSINGNYYSNCGIFLMEDNIIIVNKNSKAQHFYFGFDNIQTADKFLNKSVSIKDTIEDTDILIEFALKDERQIFLDHLEKLVEIEKLKLEQHKVKMNIEELEERVLIEEQKEQEQLNIERENQIPYKELKQLKELLDLGILTEEEYANKKDKILQNYL
nr:SHOCT domain-containing protein [Mammaliicoccus sp. Marseille-Q6498]